MSEDKYSDFVWSRAKDGQAILGGMSPTAAEFLHAAIGVSGEAGELLDAIKKHVIYNKPLDRASVVEELGDIEFYLQMMRTAMGVERHEIIQANVSKLSKRYPQGYTDRDAIERKDKQDERQA